MSELESEHDDELIARLSHPRWWQHVALFFVTCATTWLAGIYFAEGDPFAAETWANTGLLLRGGTYTLGVMAIIFAHEMGHYLQARRHDVPVSPPYFLPGLPIPGMGVLPLMGTFGAFIQMALRPVRARQLLDIGAWGPLAGFIVTVPVLMLGYVFSDVRPLPEPDALEQPMMLGNSLLLWIGQYIFFPNVPEGHDVFMHPLAMAGWTGCLLTAFNLLPLGQLDGGHILYCVLGDRFNKIVPYLFGGLILMGVLVFEGWLVLALLLWRMGIRHPPIIAGGPARGADAWLAWASIGMFALTFSPAPIVMPTLLERFGFWAMLGLGG